MNTSEYDEEHFKNNRHNLGVLLPNIRPMEWRWIRIIKKFKSSGCLLDIGCGEGFFLKYAEKYYDTYGMDISEYCIHRTGLNAKKTILSIGSINEMDFEDEKFDIITCFDVLEHVIFPDTAIKECRRVLKSSGIFVVRVPNTSSMGRKWKKHNWFAFKDKTHVSILSNEEWFRLFTKYDFEILDTFYDGLWDTPYIEKIPKLLQDFFIKIPFLALFFFGKKFTSNNGENLCLIAQKNRYKDCYLGSCSLSMDDRTLKRI